MTALRRMLKAGDPVDLKLWTKSGEIQCWRNCIPLRYNFYQGTQQFKLLDSQQIRQARICCIFEINGIPVHLYFFRKILIYIRKSIIFVVGKRVPYHNIMKEAYCLSCYRERRNFSKGARMACGSHAICVGCNFHYFADRFSYDLL